MRYQLFEFEDLPWFPDVIRSGGTDYLRYFLKWSELYKPCVDLLNTAMNETGDHALIDLCSGGGGYVEDVLNGLKAVGRSDAKITLTDKFPNIPAYEHLKEKSSGSIDFRADSVDVFDFPESLRGFRVMFSAIHHFKPEQVKLILKNAVNAGSPIAIFDGGEKGIIPVLGLLLFHPLAFLLFTPFMRPFRWSRILFTYIIPLIPLYTIWDGIVSILRMYTPDELKMLAHEVAHDKYQWFSGKTTNRFGIKASYLIGYPKK